MATLVQKSNGSNAINNNSAPAVTVTGNQNSVIETSTGGLGAIEVQGPDNTRPAFMTFHRPSAYATYFGLDTDNIFKVGGWSMGANKQRVFHGIADGSAPVFACRAWVHCNSAGGVLASGNVTSVTAAGSGSYQANFTTAIIDANYAGVGFGRPSSAGINASAYEHKDAPVRTTTAYKVQTTVGTAGSNHDLVSIMVFR